MKPVDWTSAPFGKLQALPENATPIASWDNQDEAWLFIAKSLRNLCALIRSRGVTESSSHDHLPVLSKVFPLQFKVYHFDNWGVLAKTDNIGEYFSDLILNNLLTRHLQAARATEDSPPRVSFGATRQYAWPQKDLTPFMCVTGSVKDCEGLLNALVRLSYIDADVYTHILMVEEYHFSNPQDEMLHVAQEVSEKIYAILLEMETPGG